MLTRCQLLLFDWNLEKIQRHNIYEIAWCLAREHAERAWELRGLALRPGSSCERDAPVRSAVGRHVLSGLCLYVTFVCDLRLGSSEAVEMYQTDTKSTDFRCVV